MSEPTDVDWKTQVPDKYWKSFLSLRSRLAEATELVKSYCDGCPAATTGQKKEACPDCGIGKFLREEPS